MPTGSVSKKAVSHTIHRWKGEINQKFEKITQKASGSQSQKVF